MSYGNTYRIQVSKNSLFFLPEKDEIGSGLSYTVDSDLTDGKYYWRVKAINSYAVESPWSTVRNFTVDSSAPIAPILKLPLDLASVLGTPTYSWNTSVGAVKYQFGYDAVGCTNPANKSTELALTSYKPATQPVGAWYWCVRARDLAGNWSSWTERTVTVNPTIPTAPVLSTPTNGLLTRMSTPQFNWNSAVYGNTYQIQISLSSTFAPVEKDVVGGAGVLSYTPDTILPDGKLYWRVKAINSSSGESPWSAARYIIIDTNAPSAPSLKLPLDAAVVTGTPTYSWNTSTGAGAYRFGYDAGSCANPANKFDWIATTSYKPPTQPVGIWKWCVQARDAAGNESSWSERTVTVNPTIPAAPALVAPSNSLLTNAKRPLFNWNSISYGNTYRIQISMSSTFATIEKDITGGAGVLTYTPDTDLPDGKLYWRVKAINSSLIEGPWSLTRSFMIDTNPPAIPVLKLPLHLSVVTVIPVYSWGSSLGANAYQFQLDTHADCLSPVYTSPVLLTTSHKPVSQSFGVFYWCGRAKDAAGNWSPWSLSRKLTITPF